MATWASLLGGVGTRDMRGSGKNDGGRAGECQVYISLGRYVLGWGSGVSASRVGGGTENSTLNFFVVIPLFSSAGVA